MIENDKTILVVDGTSATADNVRELIEFMDTPCVITAAPSEWRARLGKRRLEALFVGHELTDRQVTGLLDELSDVDPNVPVVLLQNAQS